MQHTKLSHLMRLSWDIQRRKQKSRSKPLTAAWAIVQNEDVTIYHLVQKHNTRQVNTIKYTQKLTLFQAS